MKIKGSCIRFGEVRRSAARLLDRLGAIVTVNDGKPFEENPAQSLLEEGIKVVTGGHPLELLMKTLQSWLKIQNHLFEPMVEKRLKKAFQSSLKWNWPI